MTSITVQLFENLGQSSLTVRQLLHQGNGVVQGLVDAGPVLVNRISIARIAFAATICKNNGIDMH